MLNRGQPLSLLPSGLPRRTAGIVHANFFWPQQFRNLTLPDGTPSFAVSPAFGAEPRHIFASCVRRNGEQILRHAQVLGKFWLDFIASGQAVCCVRLIIAFAG